MGWEEFAVPGYVTLGYVLELEDEFIEPELVVFIDPVLELPQAVFDCVGCDVVGWEFQLDEELPVAFIPAEPLVE